MNYVKALNNLGLEMRQLPCFTQKGAPTATTPGDVGEMIMDTFTGDVYKCVAVNAKDGVYTWENISGVGGSGYYSTAREEVGKEHEDINAAYIFGLYDALVAEYPDNVRKIPIQSDDGTFTNYVYEISTGDYTEEGFYAKYQFAPDKHIKKRKFLVACAFHGSERKTTFSTYRFVRDVLMGHNVPQVFIEGTIIQVLPVANPVGFNAFEYKKGKINLDRDFDNDEPQPETQAVKKWLQENSDAVIFIDHHNNGMVNENVAIIGLSNEEVDRAKRCALRGIDRVIPYWRDVIGYHPVLVPVVGDTSITDERVLAEPVFAYTSGTDELTGWVGAYAQNVVGIPSLVMETSSYYGDYDEWKANETAYPAEPIAMGAEALGNILIELFSETSEVVDMTKVNDKLDTLLETVNSGFHSVSGSFTLDSDIAKPSDTSVPTYAVSCPSGAKAIVISPDDATYEAIKAKTDTNYVLGINCIFTSSLAEAYEGVQTGWAGKTQKLAQAGMEASNNDGVSLFCLAMVAGTYNWTAYYWNE